MRDGWERKKLGEVCLSIQDGAHESPRIQFDTPGDGRFLYITSKNIRTNCMDLENVSYVERDFHDRIFPRCMPSVGDVLLTKDGANTGNVTLNTVDEPFSLLSSVCLIKCDPAALCPSFLSYYIQSPDGLLSITGQMSGAAIRRIVLRDIKLATIPLPILSEQQRIVGILDEAFEGIAAARENAEKNLRNARALIQPAFMTILSKLDQSDWHSTTVEGAARSEKGSIRTGPFGSQLLHGEFVDQGIPVLGIDNAVQNYFAWGRRRYITPQKFAVLSRYQVRPGDVLITIMGTCGRCAVVPDDIPTAINSKHLCCITLDRRRCLPEYLHAYFLWHPAAQDFLSKQAKGSIMSGLNMGLIKELPLVLPSIEQQLIIVERVSEVREVSGSLKAVYERKLAALDEFKASLLHQAFSGDL